MSGLLTGPDGGDGVRRALVLAGGGMRVAWQSGVVSALAAAGLRFQHVDGSSGGTITTAMLLSGLEPTEMVRRWSALDVRRFSAPLPLRDYLRGPGRWPALVDARGIRDQVLPRLGVDLDAVRSATARTGAVGTFNVCDFTAKTCVAIPNDALELPLLVAAVSLPVLMPAVDHAGRSYTDAVWIKDANVLEAVRRGADEIWLVWCIGNTPRYREGPLEQYVHMIEMSASGGLFAELAVLADINARRRAGETVLGSRTPVTLHVVRPETPLPLDPSFFTGRITADTLIDLGHRDACSYLAAARPEGVPLDPSITAMTDAPPGIRLRARRHGTLTGLGPTTLDLVTEIRDLAAFRADPAAGTPVVGHLDLRPASPGGPAANGRRPTSRKSGGARPVTRTLLRGGTMRVLDGGPQYGGLGYGAPQYRGLEYRLDAVLDGDRTSLVAVTPERVRTAPARTARDRAIRCLPLGCGPLAVYRDGRPIGELRMGPGDAASFLAALEPSGTHDLAGRIRVGRQAARTLFGRGPAATGRGAIRQARSPST